MKNTFLAFLFLLFPAALFAQAPVTNFILSTTDSVFCSGDSVKFYDASSNAPSGWSWNFNSTNNANITASISVSTSQADSLVFTNFTSLTDTVVVSLIASNGNGPGTTFTKNIYIKPAPPKSGFILSNTTICKDSAITFTDTSKRAATWDWNFGNGSPSTNTTSTPSAVTFNTLGGNLVQLVTTNSCGSDTAKKIINIVGLPTASFTVPTTFCNNQPLMFKDTSIGNVIGWLWNFGGGATDTSHRQNPSKTFATPGNVTVSLIAYNACGASTPFNFTIKINNCLPPIAGFKFLNDTVCMNTPIEFIDTSKNGPNVLNWVFQGSTPASSNNDTALVSFNSEGVYQVSLTAQNSFGSSTTNTFITVLRCLKPIANFISEDKICLGACVDFENISTEAPFTSQWFFEKANKDSVSTIHSGIVCYDSVGTFAIKLVSTNIYGSDTTTHFINVMPSPRILNSDTCIIAGNKVKLMAIGQGTLTWSPNIALSTETGDTTIASPINKVLYTVSDTTSCPSIDTVEVCIIYQNAYVTSPNTFTPDGNGKNDLFKITTNIPLNEFSLKIYNRLGEQVFYSDDYLTGWDGTYKGVPQNSGVFIYIVSYRDLGDNQYKTFNGNLTLIR